MYMCVCVCVCVHPLPPFRGLLHGPISDVGTFLCCRNLVQAWRPSGFRLLVEIVIMQSWRMSSIPGAAAVFRFALFTLSHRQLSTVQKSICMYIRMYVHIRSSYLIHILMQFHTCCCDKIRRNKPTIIIIIINFENVTTRTRKGVRAAVNS